MINQNAGYLAIDIANAFTTQYGSVVLMAGIVKPLIRELNPHIKIQKVIKYNRKSISKRIFTWGWGSLQIFFLLLFKYRDFEVFYTSNPPMACFSSLLIKNKFSVLIYDVYPDALKSIGITHNSVLYKCWSNWNRRLFKRADKIIAISEGMAVELTNYASQDKINVISNWSGFDKSVVVNKEDNPFIKKHNLYNRFTVLYSGNIGFTHCVETIVDIAIMLENDKNVCFIFIGEGGQKVRLLQKAKQYNLDNCIFLTWQPSEILQYSLAAADLAVVTMNDGNTAFSVPSKTYNLLAVGAPLLCIAPDHSELATMIKKYNNGICYTKDRIKEMAQFVSSLSTNKEMQNKLSQNSFKAFNDYSYTNARYYLKDNVSKIL